LKVVIALVDYGMGNLRSVQKALQQVGGDVVIAKTADDITRADRVVLPGVGAFADCMQNLQKQGLRESICEAIQKRKPFLGICLGYQALFEQSEEGGKIPGLGIFHGQVVRFPNGSLKVPQIGWNQIQFQTSQCPLLKGLSNGSYVYFVHSYYPKPSDAQIVCTSTEYGLSFASMIWKENVFACQFHPEKSQSVGLQILSNFVKL
jgi:imidazole glycerol-phosphate synthase subunit HisH